MSGERYKNATKYVKDREEETERVNNGQQQVILQRRDMTDLS